MQGYIRNIAPYHGACLYEIELSQVLFDGKTQKEYDIYYCLVNTLRLKFPIESIEIGDLITVKGTMEKNRIAAHFIKVLRDIHDSESGHITGIVEKILEWEFK